MGKHDGLCVEMMRKTDRPPIPGKSDVLMFGADHVPAATDWVEITTVTGDFMMMEGTPKGAEKIIHVGPNGHKGGPYPKTNRNADRTYFFYGTDPEQMDDLGATVRFHIGEGADEQVFTFESPRAIFVPKGVRHGPVFVSDFRRNLIIFSVLGAPTRDAAGIETDFDYERE